MKTFIHDYDMNVFLSDNYRDINFARENKVAKQCIITNGAGEDEFLGKSEINVRKEIGIASDSFLILHVGSFTAVKGHKEALDMFLKSNVKNIEMLSVETLLEQFEQWVPVNRRALHCGRLHALLDKPIDQFL